MKQKITIHYDFTDGSELPFGIAKDTTSEFKTHCLEFFCTDNHNAVVVRKDGRSIAVKDLLTGKGNHTNKEIRFGHNLHKMLVADSFIW